MDEGTLAKGSAGGDGYVDVSCSVTLFASLEGRESVDKCSLLMDATLGVTPSSSPPPPLSPSFPSPCLLLPLSSSLSSANSGVGMCGVMCAGVRCVMCEVTGEGGDFAASSSSPGATVREEENT